MFDDTWLQAYLKRIRGIKASKAATEPSLKPYYSLQGRKRSQDLIDEEVDRLVGDLGVHTAIALSQDAVRADQFGDTEQSRAVSYILSELKPISALLNDEQGKKITEAAHYKLLVSAEKQAEANRKHQYIPAMECTIL